MNGYRAFVRKELLEAVRTHKVLILFSLFLLFGLASPLLAKFLPEILRSMPMEGIEITVPEPTKLDGYAQFFKNNTQIGVLGFLLLFGGMLSQDVTQGTIVNMLTKGLGRGAVILAKFSAAALLWTLALLLSISAALGYTVLLFGDAAVPHLGLAMLSFWLFGLFLLALLLFSSTLVKGGMGGLLLTGGVLALLLLANILPPLSAYNPMTLVAMPMPLLTGAKEPMDLLRPVLSTVFLLYLGLHGAVLLFQKKPL